MINVDRDVENVYVAQKKKHKIKITQLYHLVKCCIIYETQVDINSVKGFSKENIFNIFKKKDDDRFICANSCNFKTVYEYIIEELIINRPKDELYVSDYNHHKYVAKIRDYIINNFETNLFPVFDKKYCPDLMITNFNPNLFFFDFEINKIITSIKEKTEINNWFLNRYLFEYDIIRIELGLGYLTCLIESYRDFLKTWYNAELKIKEISDKNDRDNLISNIKNTMTSALGVVAAILGLKDKKIEMGYVVAVAALIPKLEDMFIKKVSKDELSLLEKLNTLIKDKKFIYKNAEWDDTTHNTLKDRFTSHLLFSNLRTNNSEIHIKKLIKFNNLDKFDFNKSCRYVYYLSCIIFLETAVRLITKIDSDQELKPVDKEQKKSSVVVSTSDVSEVSSTVPADLQRILQAQIKTQLKVPPDLQSILQAQKDINSVKLNSKIDTNPSKGGYKELSINRRKNISRRKLLNKINKMMSKKKY